MAKQRKISIEKFEELDKFLYAAEIGNLEDVKKFVPMREDMFYEYPNSGNALDRAILYNQLIVAKYLLDELGFGLDPKLVGKALIYATTGEAIRLLACYNPDCTITNNGGLNPRDLYIRLEEYDLVKVYDQCALPKLAVNERLLRRINGHCNLEQWSYLYNAAVPEKYYQQLREFDKEHPYAPKAKKQKLFKIITSKVSLRWAI